MADAMYAIHEVGHWPLAIGWLAELCGLAFSLLNYDLIRYPNH